MYERYVELRNQKGVSDYRVAKDTGIPKSTFSDWKSGRSKPKIAKLKILAGYFGVAVDELISATDETLVSIAAVLTAIDQISIVLTTKKLWRQQQQLLQQLEMLQKEQSEL